MRSIERQDESYADIDREVEDIIKSFGTMLTDIPYDDYDDVDDYDDPLGDDEYFDQILSGDYDDSDVLDMLVDPLDEFGTEYLNDKFYAASVDADYDSEMYVDVEEEYE